jgi:lipoate-protein ligase A
VTWAVARAHTTAADFHARDIPDPAERTVWVCEATGPALVLGSAQPDAGVDRDACSAAGVDVVRRRSGGGAVLVVPGEVLWVDLVLPAGDPLWQDDVGRAFHWVGDAWAAALAELGVRGEVHRGPLVRSPWSRQVCFAGLGPGEVTVGGRKVVGISQRRTRAAARFQCAALAAWDPGTVVRLLGLPSSAADDLAEAAAATGVPLDALLQAFVQHLP